MPQTDVTTIAVQLEDVIGHEVNFRIMPLGASITYGYKSTDGNGYRKRLRDAIITSGGVDSSRVDMVGSIQAGNMKDNDVEAHSGYRIDQVRVMADASVPKWKPNVVLINAGTNDALQNFKLDEAADRMRGLVESVLDNMAPGPVLLSTLLINANSAADANVVAINNGYRALVEAMRQEHKPVVLVEMYNVTGLGLDDLHSDGTHPTDSGYQVMGTRWWDAIVGAAQNGLFNQTTSPTLTDLPGADSAPAESGGSRLNSPLGHLMRGIIGT